MTGWRILTVYLGVVVASCGWPLQAGAGADPAACVTLADDAIRLACYDAAMGREAIPRSAPTTAPLVPAAAATAATPAAAAASVPAKDPVAEFGLTEREKQARDPVKAAEAAAAPTSISGTVTSVSHRKFGEFVVVLDNGQVWEQSEQKPSAVVRVGDLVSIKKGALSSYTLVTPRRVPTRVRRLK